MNGATADHDRDQSPGECWKTVRSERPSLGNTANCDVRILMPARIKAFALMLLCMTGACDRYGRTDLMDAASRGDLGKVVKLVAQDADVDARDDFGDAALVLACRKKQWTVAEALIDAGADPNIANDNAGSALINAVLERQYTIASRLVLSGANVNAMTRDGTSVLAYAVAAWDLRIIQLLLNHGADATFVDPSGEGLLIGAVQVTPTDPAGIRLLLDHGADPLAAGRSGSALDQARRKGAPADVITLLEAATAWARDKQQTAGMSRSFGRAWLAALSREMNEDVERMASDGFYVDAPDEGNPCVGKAGMQAAKCLALSKEWRAFRGPLFDQMPTIKLAIRKAGSGEPTVEGTVYGTEHEFTFVLYFSKNDTGAIRVSKVTISRRRS